nr:SNW domain-containing protein 1 (SNW1) [Euglena gracilis]
MAAVGDIFGDGGAFPELHYEQFPLGMGKKAASHALTRRAAVPTRHEVTAEDLRRPSEEDTADLLRLTAALLSDGGKQTMKAGAGDGKATFIRYTPKQSGPDGARIIRLVEAPVDPLEPPKFKHKRVPRGPPSPPAPVNHSPPRKLTPGDMAAWKIPPCISNWKNPKGYTIPLDKRLAADGRGLQETTINDGFAKLSESLFAAERNARTEVESRMLMAKQLASKQKQKKEEELRKLAVQAKEERARGNREEAPAAPAVDRYELKRELEREKRKEARAGKRDKERDVSEKIALGQATQSRSSESFYDTRLFNQHSGLGGGFGNDEDYNVYDKALFRGAGGANYRPDRDRIAAERDRMGKTEKFSQSLEFERDQEDDPFGLGQILTEAKGNKRSYDDDAGDSRKKQRA